MGERSLTRQGPRPAVRGHLVDGHQVGGHQVDGHQGDGHQVGGHQVDGHQVDGHQARWRLFNHFHLAGRAGVCMPIYKHQGSGQTNSERPAGARSWRPASTWAPGPGLADQAGE